MDSTIETDAGATFLLIAGHARSGTTVLNTVINRHPDILMLYEFGCFKEINGPYPSYRKSLRLSWHKRRILVATTKRFGKVANKLASCLFVRRFLLRLSSYIDQPISYDIITDCLTHALPASPIIGDKYPRYIEKLDRYAAIPELKRIVIYRDCRAVVRSALEMSRTKWVGKPAAERYGTTERIAHSWVKAIETMEAHRDKVHIIRYEDFVTDPEREAVRLGAYLDVKPEGFRTKMVTSARMKKYIGELSADDLKVIDDIAGPTMRRLGYH